MENAEGSAFGHSEPWLGLLIEHIKGYAIFSLDPEGRVATWNAAAARVKGYTAQEILGEPISRFYTDEDREAGKPEDLLRRAAIEGRAHDEGWRLRKGGTPFWADVLITALRDHNGRLVGFGKVTRDLTDDRRAEQALRERAMLQYANVLVRNLDDKIIFWNDGDRLLYGFSSEEAVGQCSHDLLHTSFPTPLQEIKAHLFEKGVWEGELRHRNKQGCEVIVLSRWVLHSNPEGKALAIVELNTDITGKKEAEEQLRQLARELDQRVKERTAALRESNEALEAFSFTVSHDLRAPLRSVQGFAKAVLEDYYERLDDEGKDYLSRICKAVERMDHLILDLLAYSRLAQLNIEPQPVNLDAVIQDVVEALRTPLQESLAQLTVRRPLGIVMGERTTLAQVFMNLVNNALKFVAPGTSPLVRIFSERRDGWLRLSVHDNGIGIAAEHQGKIFAVFERLHGTEEYPGTGVGLAIVRKAMERLGGRYGVDSTPGCGSTF